MALNQYIAVKAYGNPEANSGFTPLLLVNNPSFTIEDQFYVGFDNCSYFYTIKTMPTQTVFKLVKNNVRSFGAARLGSLVIAFSIPKNYKLDGGFTPYDVLNKLKAEFLDKCMTCKDSVRETYEFNSGRVDQHVLDEVAQSFTISPSPTPVRMMKAGAPIGYVVFSDAEIEELFHDINYPEFDNFSEVIVAETVGMTKYQPITNLMIPRQKIYRIYVDGAFMGNVSNIHQLNTAKSNMPMEYYDNGQVSFTIQNLLDGDAIEGVTLDEVNEEVRVLTTGLAKPKQRRIEVKILPKEFENYFFTHRSLLNVMLQDKRVILDNDLSFTLVGEQIGAIKRNSIFLTIAQNGKYRMVDANIYGDEYRVKVEEIKEEKIKTEKPKASTTVLPVNISPVVDVLIQIDNFTSLNNDERDVEMKLVVGLQNKEKVVASQTVSFSHAEKKVYEGHFYVPKCFSYATIVFPLGDAEWKSMDLIDVKKDVVRLTNIDFESNNKKKSKINKSLTIWVASILLSLLIGGLAGYGITTLSSEKKATKQEQQSQSRNEERSAHSDRGAKADAGVQEETPSTKFEEEADTSESVEKMTEEEADAFLEEANEKLAQDGISFDEVVSLNYKYLANEDILRQRDEANFEGKYCNRIIDYAKVVKAITSGNYDEVKALIDQKPALHLWTKHSSSVRLIVGSNQSKQDFMNHYSEITSFTSIKTVISQSSGNKGGSSRMSAKGTKKNAVKKLEER